MIITKKALARRTFLRGAGAALALPVLDAMTPALSAAASQAPTRLVFVFHPNGAIPNRWTPATKGKNFEFTPSLKALEPYRENTTILSGLAQVQGNPFGDGGGDHSREGATWLTGVHPLRSETELAVGISADRSPPIPSANRPSSPRWRFRLNPPASAAAATATIAAP